MRVETNIEEMLIHHQLAQTTADYWADVDFNGGATAHDYFVEDGVFDALERVFAGRAAIRDFYTWGRGERVARHVISNFVVQSVSPTEAITRWIMCLYAADGPPPHPSKPPIMIADVEDECARDEAGRWLYRRRTLNACFLGEIKPTIPPEADAK